MDKCDKCPDYPRPIMEIELGQGDTKIYFYHYESLPTCSRCGSLEKGTTECPHIVLRIQKKQVCLEQKSTYLVIKHESFQLSSVLGSVLLSLF